MIAFYHFLLALLFLWVLPILAFTGWCVYKDTPRRPDEALPGASDNMDATHIAPTEWTRPESYLRENLMTDDPFEPY